MRHVLSPLLNVLSQQELFDLLPDPSFLLGVSQLLVDLACALNDVIFKDVLKVLSLGLLLPVLLLGHVVLLELASLATKLELEQVETFVIML